MPKIPATDMDTGVGVTKLNDIYGQNRSLGGSASADPLDELDRQERLDAVDELKRLREQKRLLDYKKRVEQLKEEVGAEDTTGGGLAIKGMYNFSASDLQAIAGMPTEERQKFLDTVKEISVMSTMGGASGKMNPIMQLAMMGGLGGGRQQGLTAKDVIELQQTMNQIYQNAGHKDDDFTRSLTLKLLTETLPSWQNQSIQNMQVAYQAREQALKEQITNPLEMMSQAKEIAGMMGYTPGGIDKEVALARLQMENTWKLQEFQFRKDEINNQKMLGVVKQILENVNIPEMVKAATRQRVGDEFRAQPQPQAPPPALPTSQVGAGDTRIVEYQCPSCKDAAGQPTKIYAPASQAQVTCQSCGGVYNVKPGSVRQQ